MPIDEDEVLRFLQPWKFENRFGIPEVSAETITIGSKIGRGSRQSSTHQASWNGKVIALKIWNEYYHENEFGAFMEWELARYREFHSVQGQLVSNVIFVSRCNETGALMIGHDMDYPVFDSDHGLKEAKEQLEASFNKMGWRQKQGSIWENESLVWIETRSCDSKRRLVAIEFGSLVPIHNPMESTTHLTSASPSLFPLTTLSHLSEVSPTEIKITYCPKKIGWSTQGQISEGEWRDQLVTLVPCHFDDLQPFQVKMKACQDFQSKLGVLTPQLLFVARERCGNLMLGFERFEEAWSTDEGFKQAERKLKQSLRPLGWALPQGKKVMKPYIAWAGIFENNTKVDRLVVVDPCVLVEVDPNAVDEESDSSTDERATKPNVRRSKRLKTAANNNRGSHSGARSFNHHNTGSSSLYSRGFLNTFKNKKHNDVGDKKHASSFKTSHKKRIADAVGAKIASDAKSKQSKPAPKYTDPVISTGASSWTTIPNKVREAAAGLLASTFLGSIASNGLPPDIVTTLESNKLDVAANARQHDELHNNNNNELKERHKFNRESQVASLTLKTTEPRNGKNEDEASDDGMGILGDLFLDNSSIQSRWSYIDTELGMAQPNVDAHAPDPDDEDNYDYSIGYNSTEGDVGGIIGNEVLPLEGSDDHRGNASTRTEDDDDDSEDQNLEDFIQRGRWQEDHYYRM